MCCHNKTNLGAYVLTFVAWAIGWSSAGADVSRTRATDPPPAGKTFQIREGSVVVSPGRTSNDEYTIAWDVSGDERAIRHYKVSLIAMHPERPKLFGKTYFKATVRRGTRQVRGALQEPLASDVYYLAPRKEDRSILMVLGRLPGGKYQQFKVVKKKEWQGPFLAQSGTTDMILDPYVLVSDPLPKQVSYINPMLNSETRSGGAS